MTPETETKNRIEQWLAAKKTCRIPAPAASQQANRPFLDPFDAICLGAGGYYSSQDVISVGRFVGHIQPSPMIKINVEPGDAANLSISPCVVIHQTPDVNGEFKIRVLQARQGIAEVQFREFQSQFNRLSAYVRAKEKTVESIADQIGIAELLPDIVGMTKRVFGADPAVKVGELHDPSLVFSVNVGADADVDEAVKRETEWYERVAHLSPESDGLLQLLLNYE